ncbi:homeobox protein MOX-1-like [Sphaerodactylus townsendi]|uniref:homeobox protein MOX-1-like n=1 Tax=Sphaerodactylus townsendi TaxID=933632 RepID=UPI002025E899|nr:homeobox protein MOX-1-like [Sphaerodactylus townsendi]
MEPPASSCMRNSQPTSTMLWECLRNHHPEAGPAGPQLYPQAPFSFHPKSDFGAYADFSTSCLATAPQSLPREDRVFDEHHPSFHHSTWHFTTSEGRRRLPAELALGSGEPENGSPRLVDSAVATREDYGLARNTTREVEKKSCRRKKGNSACKRKEQEQQKDRNLQPKKQRLVFTDLQRRTLIAIFKENKRPSKEMQMTISQQLGLELNTVSNFFMNARRRCMHRWQEEPGTNPGVPSSSTSTFSKA